MLRKGVLTGLLIAVVASGCATVDQRRITESAVVAGTTPYEAIQRAAEAAPSGVPGPFLVRIQAMGADSRYTYLNTELDYRDQRNLSLELAHKVVRALELRLGTDLRSGLIGKQLLVDGEARRVRIVFFANGKPSGKYYYQTHVRVSDVRQMKVLPDSE